MNNDFNQDAESDEEDFRPQAQVDSDNGDDNDDAVRRPAALNGSRNRNDNPARRDAPRPTQGSESPEPKDEGQSVDNDEDGEDGAGDEEDDQDAEDDDQGGEGDGDEDDDDDGDGDEDEDDELRGHRRKRHKRDRRNQFLDVEAEVEDEDEEAEEDEDELPGGDFLADTHPDDELPAGADVDDRRHRELDRQRQQAENVDVELAAARLREKYGRRQAAGTGSLVVPQRLLLPSVEDPTIWGVRCKQGKEREVVYAVQKRLEERLFSDSPLAITSCFERGGTMAGYVYVEARRQVDVMTAMDGLPSAYPRTNMILVPINEMPDLLRTRKSKMLEPGAYVRIKRGKYQGDLAQVDEVETNGLEVDVRLVPRLDYGLNEDTNAPLVASGANGAMAKRKRQNAAGKTAANRPPQRLFNEAEARKKHAKHVQQTSTYSSKEFTYLGDIYREGFLIKNYKVQFLQTEDVNPTLEEVTRFTAAAQDGTENLDLAGLAASLKSASGGSAYLPGDAVEIFRGEQHGVAGKAVTVRGDIVSIKVTEGQLQGQTIDAPVRDLRKRFQEGDHVRVIGGSKYRDEVGLVVKIKDDRVTFLSDATQDEITVFSKDLRASTDSNLITGSTKYDLYDLVQLDPATVACVIKVDRESLKVLDQTGSVRTLLPSNVSNKLERRRFAVATDRDGTEVRHDDTVKEHGGEQRQGRVLHIHRIYLFIQNRQQTENAGIFVARTSGVVTVAAKGGRIASGPDLNKMNPAMQRNGAGNASAAMPPPKSMGRDRLIGKTVTIRKGPNKGLLGIVKDTTDTEARVELHAKNKVININKESLSVKDPVTGQSIEFGRFSGGGRASGGYSAVAGGRGFPGSTPSRVPESWEGSRTPAMNGGKTPAWSSSSGGGAGGGIGGAGWTAGSRTPGWAKQPSGGRTPGWADGSRTSNPYGDGNRTSYGGATAYGGATTWNPNSSTPFHPSSMTASTSMFSSGSRTPAAWNEPAAASSFGAASAGGHPSGAGAGAYDAPTPGARLGSYRDHPTPGAGAGAGGGAAGNTYAALTPGATPGVWGAGQTPGVIGDDEGYED